MTKFELNALRSQAEANPGWATTRITNNELLQLLNRIDSVERQLGGQQTAEMTPVTEAAIAEYRAAAGVDANGSPV